MSSCLYWCVNNVRPLMNNEKSKNRNVVDDSCDSNSQVFRHHITLYDSIWYCACEYRKSNCNIKFKIWKISFSSFFDLCSWMHDFSTTATLSKICSGLTVYHHVIDCMNMKCTDEYRDSKYNIKFKKSKIVIFVVFWTSFMIAWFFI